MLNKQNLEALAESALFAGYSENELAALLERYGCEKQDFAKGEVIYSPQSFRRDLAVLLSGRVLVTKADGGLVVSTLESGSIFGAAALFNAEEDYVSCLTARVKSEVLFFTQECVRALIDNEERFRLNYITYLSYRIRFLSAKIDSLVQGSGEKKLSSYLLAQMDGGSLVNPGCSMTELAARLNMGRASLYRELQKMEEQGVIARRSRCILVRDAERLTKM